MDEKIMNFLYQNPIYLNYIRYHPEWYKILYYTPEKMNEFIKEAKKELKLTTFDKIENFKKQLGFLESLIDYLTKK